MSNPFEDDPNFQEFLRCKELESEMREKVDKFSEDRSFEMEQKLLMKFWAECGDSTETYFEAMNIVSDFVRILAYFRKRTEKLRKHPPRLKMLSDMLCACIQEDAETCVKMHEFHDEFQKKLKEIKK